MSVYYYIDTHYYITTHCYIDFTEEEAFKELTSQKSHNGKWQV